jgi:glycosyltransferase involved in cell wall biosynthesis
MTLRFHHRIETALPLQSSDGTIKVTGWCLQEGVTREPNLKLVSAHGEIPVGQRHARPDVGAAMGIPGGGALWGFSLHGKLPAGAHLLTLLAAPADTNEWRPLQRFTAVVFSRGLQASIEIPTELTLRDSSRIQGWAAHPEESLREVSLHYGTRRVNCQYGLPRSDVPNLLSTSPDAIKSGFITAKNAPAGQSAIRVVAIDAHGARHVARTNRFADINCDEENPAGLNLPLLLARLSATRQPSVGTRSPSANPARPLRMLFVLYGDFTSNSAIHVAALANAMIDLGHECIVAVPEHPETTAYHRGARFRAMSFDAVPPDGRIFGDAKPPDLIHAWTTRENVRRFCEPLRKATGAKLVVHLEDHELRILELNLNRSLSELLELDDAELERLVPATLSHPRRSREFLASADGVTVITEKLRELAPAGPPVHLFWPAADPEIFFPRPIPTELRVALGFGEDHTVLFYHGNVHAANQEEVFQLYTAVVKLNAEGYPTTLLRAGRDSCDFPSHPIINWERHVISLGQIKHHHLPPLLALADFFVQPGEADVFNDYRFPSKLPEFFALGRPVILPLTNLGHAAHHDHDAYVLKKADAPGIAAAIRTLRNELPMRTRLSAGAAAFSERMFSWQRSAEGLLSFYGQLTAFPASSRTHHV